MHLGVEVDRQALDHAAHLGANLHQLEGLHRAARLDALDDLAALDLGRAEARLRRIGARWIAGGQ
jgi:hypothetical protein